MLTKLAMIFAMELVFVSDAFLTKFPIQERIFLFDKLPTLMAKAKKKKGRAGGGGGGGGIKGFGSSAPTAKKKQAFAGTMDRSKEAMAFYDYTEQNGAGDNLKRVALGQFPLPGTNFDIRGVIALKDIKKGDVIIRIPYEIAVNLGAEGEDPTLPGMNLLEMYCSTLLDGNTDGGLDQTTYFKMLPKYMGSDCLGSTDFFSDKALDTLQSHLVKEETLQRRERVKKRFENTVATNDSFPTWIDSTPITEEHLRWAVWLITSRVLTVQGDASTGKSYRLLIPFLDMCNHDRSSPHVLSGRAVPGGELKVVAGAPVQAGEQVNICYGGGVAGNDRFLQDYGFLDSGTAAYDIVAQQILGKRRLVEGSNKGRNISEADMERTLEELRSTSIAQDEELLSQEKESDVRAAMEYRLGVKKALAGYIIM